MAEHHTLRSRFQALAERGHEPAFELTRDPGLVAFAHIFVEAELVALDANKHLRTDSWSPIYDCWTESRRRADAAVERFEVSWAPTWQRDDPLTGFRHGWDSALLGSTPPVAMPRDERTHALLLLVTSNLVHLSASRDGGQLVVRGAVEAAGSGFRFLTLEPSAVADSLAPTASMRGRP